jgi:dihydroorotase-like cyclic amidohydrolase
MDSAIDRSNTMVVPSSRNLVEEATPLKLGSSNQITIYDHHRTTTVNEEDILSNNKKTQYKTFDLQVAVDESHKYARNV